MTRWKKIWWS